MSIDTDALVNAAGRAMDRAYAPYSKFRVGAALLTKDDKIITGVNVENASYGGAICAERGAVVRAVAEGHRSFKAIAVCTAAAEPTPLCGICRQFLVEFGDMKVIMASSTSRKRVEMELVQLLPMAFTVKKLEK